MATSVHSVARDLLVAAYQDADVATAANVLHVTWVGRVLKGDKDGYIGQLHRGRLPAVEIFQEPGEAWKQSALDQGVVTSEWKVRVHVGLPKQVEAEELARDILYAGLIKVRAQNYFKIGDEVVNSFYPSPLGFYSEATITVVNAMGRDTYETAPAGGSTPTPSEGEVGGISLTVNYGDTSPITILELEDDQAIDTVSIEVITPFNGTLPTATIGVDGDQERYLAAADSVISQADSVWEKDANDAGPKTVKLWLAPGGSTAGQLKVQISVTNA